MRRTAFVLVLVLLAGWQVAGAHGEADYYGVFYFQDMAEVIGFNADEMWTVRDLPDPVLDVYPQGALSAPIEPMWSLDGTALYITLWQEDGVKNTLYRYQPASDQLTPLVNSDEIGGCSGFITLVSISPDGRYGLLCSAAFADEPILDLQTGTLIKNDLIPGAEGVLGTECYVTAFAWALAEQRVMVGKHCGLMNGSSTLETIDTADWTTIRYEPMQGLWLWFPSVLIPSNSPYLLSETTSRSDTGSTIIQVAPDTGKVETVSEGTRLQVAADRSFGVFVRDGHFVRLATDSLTVNDTELADHNCQPAGVADSLYYVCQDTETSLVSFSENDVTETVIYEGAADNLSFDTARRVWAVADENGVELFDLNGEQWTSQGTLEGNVAVSGHRAWHYPWFSFDWVQAGETEPREISVNIQTGETAATPEAGLHLASFSPDGLWWVYTNDADELNEQVAIYNHASGERTFQAEGAYFAPDSYGSFGPAQYIYWSQVTPQ